MDRDDDTIIIIRSRDKGTGSLSVRRTFTPMELGSRAHTPSAALIAFALSEMGDALDKEEAQMEKEAVK